MKKLPLFVFLIIMSSFALAVELPTNTVLNIANSGVSRTTLSDFTSEELLYYTNRGTNECLSRVINVTDNSIDTSLANAPRTGALDCATNNVAYNPNSNEMGHIDPQSNTGWVTDTSLNVLETVGSSRFDDVIDMTSYNNQYYTTYLNGGLVRVFDSNLLFVDEKTYFEMGLPFNSSTGANRISYDRTNGGFILVTGLQDLTLYVLDNQLNYIGVNYTLESFGAGPFDYRNMAVSDRIYIREFNSADIFVWDKYEDFDIPLIVGEVEYNTSGLCVDVNGDSVQELCTDANVLLDMFGDPQITCNSLLETQACNLGCNNVNTDGVVSGVCENAVGPQECGFNGLLRCQTINTYAECGDFNSDGRLEYGNILSCGSQQICVDTELGAQCVGNTLDQDLWTQEFISVDLQFNNTNAFQENEATINIVSSSLGASASVIAGAGFFPITQYFAKTAAEELTSRIEVNKVSAGTGLNAEYSSFSCDFERDLVQQDFTERLVNSTNPYNTNLVNGDNNLEVEFVLEEFSTGTHYVEFTDGGSNVNILEFDYDSTSKTLIISDWSTGRIIYNQTSLQATDDLRRVYVKTIFNKEIEQTSYEVQVIRIPLNQDVVERAYSLPVGFINPGLGVPDNINVNSSSNISLVEITVTKTGNYPSFEFNAIDEETVKLCTAVSVGCRNVIVWAQDDINGYVPPNYHFYELVQSCPTQIGSITDEQLASINSRNDGERDFLENILGRDLDQNEKLILAIAVIAFVFGGMVFLAKENEDPGTLIFGTIIGGLLIVWFAAIGYIPAWVVLLFIGIGAALVPIFFNRRGG